MLGSSSLLQMLRAEDRQQVLPSTGDLNIPAVAPSATLSGPSCPPYTSPLCHSKEGTYQPQVRHWEEEKGLSWAPLPARGGICPPWAPTQTSSPWQQQVQTCPSCWSQPFPHPVASPTGIALKLQSRDAALSSPSPSHRSLQRTFLLQGCLNPWHRLG